MNDGRWITINGNHVFIKDGQSPMDAFIRQKVKNKKKSRKDLKIVKLEMKMVN